MTVTLDTELLSGSAGDRLFLCKVLEFPSQWLPQMPKHHTKSPFHIIPFGLEEGIRWTLALWRGLHFIHTEENHPGSATRGEGNIGPTGRTAWLQGRLTHRSQAISLPSLFLAGFLSVLGLGMLQAQGVEHFCPPDILWRLPQEKEGASTRIRKPLPAPSAGHWKAGQARDQNVEGWTRGVRGIWGPSVPESTAPIPFDFPPTRREAGEVDVSEKYLVS